MSFKFSGDTIQRKEFDDGFIYEISFDEAFDFEYNFKIYATSGTKKYLNVDKVIDPSDEDEFNLQMQTAVYKLPLHLYAHSGVSISVSPYGDPWDSGQCGFAVLEQEDIDFAGIKPEEYESYLKSEVARLDAMLRGHVVYWVTKKQRKCGECGHVAEDVLDSCGGYVFTSVSEIDEFVASEAMENLEYNRKKMKEAEHGTNAVTIGDD